VSSIKLEGHLCWIKDILPLLSLCSSDETIKVWDCQTGACLRTLNEHTNWVTSLAMHPTRKQFASGSQDHSVIIWSSETSRGSAPHSVSQRSANDRVWQKYTLYAGIFHNVMPCNAPTGEVGLVLIPGAGYCESLSFRKTPLCIAPSRTNLPHSHSHTTVPAPKPWTPSAHELWPLSVQHQVHRATLVLWQVCD
jgi:WD40 repeat protein